MKQGNWIALDKNLSKHFPDREFSKIEAAYSLTLDYDNNKLATISGYASLWGWSRSKVRNFLEEMGVDIDYPFDTSKKQKQKGQIKVQKKDRSETEKGQIRMVDTKASQDSKDRKETESGQKKDRSKDTTSNTINKPNPKKEYTEDSKEFRLSLFLLNKIRERKPDFKMPNLQQWSEHSDYILRIDKRDPHEIKNVVEWCQKDDFWQDNILSTAKLRKQYDKLVLKMNKENGNKRQEKSATLTAMPGAISV